MWLRFRPRQHKRKQQTIYDVYLVKSYRSFDSTPRHQVMAFLGVLHYDPHPRIADKIQLWKELASQVYIHNLRDDNVGRLVRKLAEWVGFPYRQEVDLIYGDPDATLGWSLRATWIVSDIERHLGDDVVKE